MLFPSVSIFDSLHCPSPGFLIRLDNLLNLSLKVLALNQFWDLIVVILAFLLLSTLFLLQALVTLGQSSQGGKGVRTELVEDAGDEFGEFFVFAVAVDGEGV